MIKFPDYAFFGLVFIQHSSQLYVNFEYFKILHES